MIFREALYIKPTKTVGFVYERAARLESGPLSLSQASYLSICGKELATRDRSLRISFLSGRSSLIARKENSLFLTS
jgi:hypothetical protein